VRQKRQLINDCDAEWYEIETTTVCLFRMELSTAKSILLVALCRLATSRYAGYSNTTIGKNPLSSLLPTLYTQRTNTTPVYSRLFTLLPVTVTVSLSLTSTCYVHSCYLRFLVDRPGL
jgi:hypothetical protein